MSWSERAHELVRQGYTPDEAYALVAAERRAMEGARAAGTEPETPRVLDTDLEASGQLVLAPEVCVEDAA